MPYLIEPFSYEWFLTNLLSFFLLAILISITKYFYIKKKPRVNLFAKFILSLLILRLLIFHSIAIYTNAWDIEHILPVHLCGIAFLMSILVLIKFNQFIYDFLLLLGMPGAVWSFITPQINIYEPSYLYFDYFVSHAMIIFVPLYLTICENKRPSKESYLKILIVMNLFIIPFVNLINIFLKKFLSIESVNYMYLMSPPIAKNPLIINGWSYIIGLELVAIIHMILVYFFFNFFYNTNFKFKT